MSKMSKLKSVLGLLVQFAPQVLAHTKLAPIAPAVAAAMHEAEQMPGLTGEENLARVVLIAQDAAFATNAQAGHIVIDPVDVEGAAAKAIATAKAVVNIIHRAQPLEAVDGEDPA